MFFMFLNIFENPQSLNLYVFNVFIAFNVFNVFKYLKTLKTPKAFVLNAFEYVSKSAISDPSFLMWFLVTFLYNYIYVFYSSFQNLYVLKHFMLYIFQVNSKVPLKRIIFKVFVLPPDFGKIKTFPEFSWRNNFNFLFKNLISKTW